MATHPSRPRNGAALVFPALRWSSERGYALDDPAVVAALQAGVGGFLFFGGEAEAVRSATAELRSRAGRPLLFGSDLERGAGQQFEGCTSLPPALALASLGPDVVREAARITAREAGALGVRWLYAPVADVAIERDNPIVGTRAFGTEVAEAAPRVAAWVAGALEGGGAPCLKHFPGHGRTVEDSHATLPVVDAPADRLLEELGPFRAGLAEGAPSVMTAHVAFPTLDPEGGRRLAATRSRVIIQGLLRGELGFQGVVATDALIMGGIGPEPAEAGALAVAAGVDALLYPPDVEAQVAALDRAVASGSLTVQRLDASAERIASLTTRFGHVLRGEWDGVEHRRLAKRWAQAVLQAPVRWPVRGTDLHLVMVDDDLGGPYLPPSRDPFVEGLRQRGIQLRTDPHDPVTPTVVAVFAEPRGWKERAGLSADARERIRSALGRTNARGAAAGVVLFGDPRLADQLPADVAVIGAWGGGVLMQEAAAEELRHRC
jgi:beta-glucosidase-like glycosyl hydrolase